MKTILLVDDETVICAACERTLRRFRFHVEAAHTVESALRSIRETRFDAILLEFNVKSERNAHARAGNGLRVLRQLRASHATVPVLMFTAMEGEPYKAASLDAGAVDFVPKTDGVLSLVSRLRSHLRKRKLTAKVKNPVQGPYSISLRTQRSRSTSARRSSQFGRPGR